MGKARSIAAAVVVLVALAACDEPRPTSADPAPITANEPSATPQKERHYVRCVEGIEGDGLRLSEYNPPRPYFEVFNLWRQRVHEGCIFVVAGQQRTHDSDGENDPVRCAPFGRIQISGDYGRRSRIEGFTSPLPRPIHIVRARDAGLRSILTVQSLKDCSSVRFHVDTGRFTGMGTAAPGCRTARSWTDPRDVSPLDVARISHRPWKAVGEVKHTIRFRSPWRSSFLKGGRFSSRYVVVTFDVTGGKKSLCTGCMTEREVVIEYRRGELRATLLNHLGDPPRRLGVLHVWRPNQRSVSFTVTADQLGIGAYSSYRWGVKTVFNRRGVSPCRKRNTCFDLAPGNHVRLLKVEL